MTGKGKRGQIMAIRDSQDMFMMGYDSGYARACKDWKGKIDKIEETIKRKMSEYDDRNVSEYEDCLAIIDAIVGK